MKVLSKSRLGIVAMVAMVACVGFVAVGSDQKPAPEISHASEFGPVFNARMTAYVEPMRRLAMVEDNMTSLRQGHTKSLRHVADFWLELRAAGKLMEIPSVSLDDTSVDYPKSDVVAARQDLVYGLIALGARERNLEDFQRAYGLSEILKYTDLTSYTVALSAQLEAVRRAERLGFDPRDVTDASFAVNWKLEQRFLLQAAQSQFLRTSMPHLNGPEAAKAIARELQALTPSERKMHELAARLTHLDGPPDVLLSLRSALERRSRLEALVPYEESPRNSGALALR